MGSLLSPKWTFLELCLSEILRYNFALTKDCLGVTPDRITAMLTITNVLGIIIFATNALCFFYKLADRWGVPNLSVELEADRKHGAGLDLAEIILKLKKGDRCSVRVCPVLGITRRELSVLLSQISEGEAPG